MTSALLKYEASDVSDFKNESMYIIVCSEFNIDVFFAEFELLLILKLTDFSALTELSASSFSYELDLMSKFDLKAIDTQITISNTR